MRRKKDSVDGTTWEKKARKTESGMDGMCQQERDRNRDMRAIETTKYEVHDRTGWRRIVSAAATPQLDGSC